MQREILVLLLLLQCAVVRAKVSLKLNDNVKVPTTYSNGQVYFAMHWGERDPVECSVILGLFLVCTACDKR